jgi:methanogenic corrinoid protein MtbC1
MDKKLEILKEALINNRLDYAYDVLDTIISYNELMMFYEHMVPSILNSIHCGEFDYACIYQEHRMSQMVRALVEYTHQTIIKNKATLSEKRTVLIACIKDETHDLGALIGNMMFEYYGFNTIYLGADTPLKTLEIAAMDAVDYIVLSATNAYNLVAVKNSIEAIRALNKDVKIFGAGRGIVNHLDVLNLDGLINSHEAILTLIKEEGLTCSVLK